MLIIKTKINLDLKQCIFYVPKKLLIFIFLENIDNIFNSNDLVNTFEKKK